MESNVEKRNRYDNNYARWSTWVPTDEVTLQEKEDEERRLEEAKNKEFEKNNPEFCNQFIDDMEKRQESIQKKNESAEKARLKGNNFFKRKDYHRALEFYMESLRDLPYDTKTLTNIGQAYIKQKEYDDAIEFLNRVLYLDPNHVKALSRKAYVLSEKSNFEEAQECAQKALKLDANNLELSALAHEIDIIIKEKANEEKISSPSNGKEDIFSVYSDICSIYGESFKALVESYKTTSVAAPLDEKQLESLNAMSEKLKKGSITIAIAKEEETKEGLRTYIRKNNLLDTIDLCKYLVNIWTANIDEQHKSAGALCNTITFITESITEQRASKLVVLENKLISTLKPLLRGSPDLNIIKSVINFIFTCCKDDTCLKTRSAVFADNVIISSIASLLGDLSQSKLHHEKYESIDQKESVLSILTNSVQIVKVMAFADPLLTKTSLTPDNKFIVCALATVLHYFFVLSTKSKVSSFSDEMSEIVESLLGLSQHEALRLGFAIKFPLDEKTSISSIDSILQYCKSLSNQSPVAVSNCLAVLLNATVAIDANTNSMHQQIVDGGGLMIALEVLHLSDMERRKCTGVLLSRKASLMSRIAGVKEAKASLLEEDNYRMLCRRISKSKANDGENCEKWELDERNSYVKTLASLPVSSQKYMTVGKEEDVITALLQIFPMPKTDCGVVTPETVTLMPQKIQSPIILGNAARCIMPYCDEPEVAYKTLSKNELLGIEKFICAMATCQDIRVRKNIAILLAKLSRSTEAREKITKFRGMQMIVQLQNQL